MCEFNVFVNAKAKWTNLGHDANATPEKKRRLFIIFDADWLHRVRTLLLGLCDGVHNASLFVDLTLDAQSMSYMRGESTHLIHKQCNAQCIDGEPQEHRAPPHPHDFQVIPCMRSAQEGQEAETKLHRARDGLPGRDALAVDVAHLLGVAHCLRRSKRPAAREE